MSRRDDNSGPFYRSRFSPKNAKPALGAPASLLEGGDVSETLRRLPQLGQLGPQAAELSMNRPLQNNLLRKKAPVIRNLDVMRFARPVQTPFVIGTESEILLPEPSLTRVYLMVVNTHPTQTIYINFGAPANTFCIPLPPFVSPAVGGFYEFLSFIPQSDVQIVGSGAGTSGVVIHAEMEIA